MVSPLTWKSFKVGTISGEVGNGVERQFPLTSGY